MDENSEDINTKMHTSIMDENSVVMVGFVLENKESFNIVGVSFKTTLIGINMWQPLQLLQQKTFHF